MSALSKGPVKGKGGSLLYLRGQVITMLEEKDAEKRVVQADLADCQKARDEAVTVARNTISVLSQLMGHINNWLDSEYPLPPAIDPAVEAAAGKDAATERKPD